MNMSELILKLNNKEIIYSELKNLIVLKYKSKLHLLNIKIIENTRCRKKLKIGDIKNMNYVETVNFILNNLSNGMDKGDLENEFKILYDEGFINKKNYLYIKDILDNEIPYEFISNYKRGQTVSSLKC